MLILKDKLLRTTILRTALPAMMEMILYMLIGVVDVAIVGRLGAEPLAAVSLGAEIFFAVVLILEALGIGSSVLVAQAKGAGRMDEASRIAGQTVLLGLLVGSLAGIMGVLFTENIVGLFKVDWAVYIKAVSYLKITFWMAPLALTFYMINTVYRGLGRTDIPMYIALVVNIINCAGNYILVYGKLGFPQLGVAGAAWATSISHVIGCLIALAVLFSGQGNLNVKWYWMKCLRLSIVKKIFYLGIPSLGEQLFNNLSILVSVYLIVVTGTVPFAAHQVGITVESLSFMPGFGIAIAASALVGWSVGARDEKQLLRVARGSIEMALLFMGFFGLLFALFPCHIAGLFTNDAEIIAIAGLLIRIAAMEQITIAISMVMGGILKGAGDTRTPMLVTVLSTWAYRIPLTYLIIHVLHLPIYYVWLLFVSDWLIRAIIFITVYRKKKWLRRALA